MSRRPTSHAFIRQPLRIALLLLVLGAFGVQQWAMQSHWHTHATAQSLGQSAPGTDQGRAPLDKDCLWCHVASHGSAAAAPPVAFRLVAIAEHHFIRLPAGIETEFSAPPAHAWHSRGPPRA